MGKEQSKKIIPITENAAVQEVKNLIKDFREIVYQDPRELDPPDKAFKDITKTFRLGHTRLLRYIEIKRSDLKDKLFINRKWLEDFDEAASNPKRRKFRGYTFKE